MSKANSPDFVLQRRYTVGISVCGKRKAMRVAETTPWKAGKHRMEQTNSMALGKQRPVYRYCSRVGKHRMGRSGKHSHGLGRVWYRFGALSF